MRKRDLANIVRTTDSTMAIPSHPNDESAPIMFGEAGFIVQTDEGSIVLSSSDDIEVLLNDPFISLSADLFGHLMFVSYGAILDMSDEDSTPIPTRIIVGISREGALASAMRRLDNDEAIIDEEGEMVQGEMRKVLLELAQG